MYAETMALIRYLYREVMVISEAEMLCSNGDTFLILTATRLQAWQKGKNEQPQLDYLNR